MTGSGGARRRSPTRSCFQTKPELAADLCEEARDWEIPTVPILADCAYGDDTRTRLAAQGLAYVLAVSRQLGVYGPSSRSSAYARQLGGLTLPQAVLLLQPLLRCWADRCRTCNQSIDLNQLELFARRE